MLQHLIELRRLSLQTLVCFCLLFCLCFYFSDFLFTLITVPLLKNSLPYPTLIATQIAAPVLVPMKLALDTSVFLSLPVALVQLWRFIHPGLYAKERLYLKNVLMLSIFLFCCGGAFCFYLVLPFMFQFFMHSLPKGVRFTPDIAYAIDFIVWMLLVFACCFQVPLICAVLVRLQLVSISVLKQIRPYIIVAAFILGMLLTPPDVLSQVLLAVPLCLLYELGILLAKHSAP